MMVREGDDSGSAIEGLQSQIGRTDTFIKE